MTGAASGGPVLDQWRAIRRGEVGAGQANILLPAAVSSGRSCSRPAMRQGLTIADIVRENEIAWRPESRTDAFLDAVRGAMFASIDRRCRQGGILPGGSAASGEGVVQGCRRAILRPTPRRYSKWVSLPRSRGTGMPRGARRDRATTNGAAGVLPAVLPSETFTKDPCR